MKCGVGGTGELVVPVGAPGCGSGSSVVVQMYSDGDVCPIDHAAGGSIIAERTTTTVHLQIAGRMPSDVVTEE